MTSGYTDLVDQLFETQVNACVDDGVTADELAELPLTLLSEVVIPKLANLNLDCDYQEDIEFLAVILDLTKVGTLGDAGQCSLWLFSFKMHYIEATTESRRRRRLDLETKIQNSAVAGMVVTDLEDIFANISVPNITTVGFTNFGGENRDPTTDTDTSSNTDSINTTAAVSTEHERSIVIQVLTVVVACLLVAVVAVLGVQRQRERSQNQMNQHVLIKDKFDPEEVFDPEIVLKPSGIKSESILKELDPDESLEDEEVRTEKESTLDSEQMPCSPSAYVVGEGDTETAGLEYKDMRFTSGAYWTDADSSSVESPPAAPTIVGDDLRKSMKDLEPPASPRKLRIYEQDDAVNL